MLLAAFAILFLLARRETASAAENGGFPVSDFQDAVFNADAAEGNEEVLVDLSSASDGMCTMDGSLLALYRDKQISRETALSVCNNYEFLSKRLGA